MYCNISKNVRVLLRSNLPTRFSSTKVAVADNDLFKPYQMGGISLSNRFVMSPLTRCRATPEGVVSPMVAEYYQQRASAGLIVSEATCIAPTARGYALTPGVHTDAQVAAWKTVTDAVHAKGGKIVCQLWHVGRISHSSLLPKGQVPVAPSPIQAKVQVFTYKGLKDCETPRELKTEEIPEIVGQYRHAAKLAKAAGFDGVELHGANGYLLHQFMADTTNLRTDRYGGSVENRVRIVLEAAEAVLESWSGDRVGIRISPVNTVNDMSDSSPQKTYNYLIENLNRFNVGFIDVVVGHMLGSKGEDMFDYSGLRKAFRGSFMVNNGYTIETALKARKDNFADVISIGRPFISNPDLVRRLKEGAPLNKYDTNSFYGGNGKGYTDYPFLP